MAGRKAWLQRTRAERFSATMAWRSASDAVSSVETRMMPALFTSPVTLQRPAISASTASRASLSPRSARRKSPGKSSGALRARPIT